MNKSCERKLCEISDQEYDHDASPKSGHDELQQQNTTLQFDIESLKRENVRLRAELGRNGGLIQALKAALRKVETDNEHQRAELLSVRRNGERIETLKQIIRRLRDECKNLELDNRILRAELQRDADKMSLMRRSIRELTARLSRGKYTKAIQRLAVQRGALNVLTDNNYISVLSLHLAGSLQTRIPGNRRRQVGEWVNEAYALSLQEELDSGESTEEMDSGEGESTEEMDSGDST